MSHRIRPGNPSSMADREERGASSFAFTFQQTFWTSRILRISWLMVLSTSLLLLGTSTALLLFFKLSIVWMHGFCSTAFASHLRSKAIMNHPQFKMVAWFTLSICQARCYTICHRNWIKTPYKLRSQKPQLHSKELCMTCLIASTCNSRTATIIRTQDERYSCQHSPVTFVIFNHQNQNIVGSPSAMRD